MENKKSPLTKKQRHEIYKNALIELNKSFSELDKFYWDYHKGICCCLASCLVDFNKHFLIYSVFVLFPELEKYKPINSLSSYWFGINEDGFRERVRVLESLIKETE